MTVTFDDDAAASLTDVGPIVSGVFKPTNFGLEERDLFPDEVDQNGIPVAPVPTPSPETRLSIFAGTRPNGLWRLYVVDDKVFDSGIIAAGWSLTMNAAIPPATFRRGDANADGVLDVSDAVFSLRHQFLGEPGPACEDAADADDTGVIDVTDAIYTLNRLFLAGLDIPAPGSSVCSQDPSEDGLTCGSFPPCRVCTYPFINCGGICVDPRSDPFNCGGCNSQCAPSEACLGGFCESAGF